MAAMFITAAYAAGETAGQGAISPYWWVPYILILVIMYFLILRPQLNRAKEQKAMLGGIKRGDTVVTAGGIIGKVTKIINDTELQVELAEGVRVRVVRSTIAEVRTKGEVRAANDDEKSTSSSKSS
jgi:preprotein translocase subunit YajC